MKRILTLLLTLGLLASASAQTRADEVIQAVIDNQRGASGRVTITITVERPGRTSEFIIESVSDSDRSLIRVIAPAREAGQAFLIDGDNLWLYNPRLGRSLRLPPSARGDSFLGSDIAYRDLAGRDLEAHYQAAITAEEAERIELTLTPRPGAPTPYGQIVITADTATYAPLSFVYYDQRGQAVRRISFSAFDAVHGLHFPTRIEVENLLRQNERTTVLMSDYTFGIAIPEACFREAALARGC